MEHRVVIGEEVVEIPPVGNATVSPVRPRQTTRYRLATGATRSVPLGTICGARSGDKGGNANVGVWVRSAAAFRWLAAFLTAERLRELIVEARDLPVDRYELPNLSALNFVIHGLLGDGVAASLRADPQAKTLGEYLRAKVVPIPIALLA
ncbi:MAG: AtuA-related protein [Stellaceae bacterium]